MSSLRYRNEKWQVQVRRHGHTAQAKSFQTKADAQRWARQIEAELDRALIPNDPRVLSTITVAELLTRYRDTLTSTKRGHVSENKRIEVFLRLDWSRLPLARASAAVFSKHRDTRLKEVKANTVIRELGLLRSIFETARREWGYTTFVNPLADIKKPKAPEGRERRLRPGELDGLTTACGTVANWWLLPGVQIAIETGLRRGELLSVKWSHVNFGTGVLHVPFTKTDRARYIPMTDRAVEVLTELRNAAPKDADLVFPVSANAFRLAWERCRRRAQKAGCKDIRQLRFHDLRHEAVSRFFELGLNAAEVAAISGHRDMRMLFRYTHLKAEDIGAKIRKLNTELAQ